MTGDLGQDIARAEAALEVRRPEVAKQLLAPVIAADPGDGWALALLAEAARPGCGHGASSRAGSPW